MVDQNSQFYAILTNVGAAKQANADALGIPWKITQMAVGDANGTDPTPNATQLSLINEWRRAPLNQLKVDDKDNAIIVAEQIIPADVGGRWIREIALFDADGDMVAVANCAPTYKPLLSQGSGRTQVVRMNLIVSSSSNVQLKIDPSVVLATREWVTDELAKQDFKHSALVATTSAITLNGLQTVDGVALTAGARVLVKHQTPAKDNGLYLVVAGSAWTRCVDADSSSKVTPGMLVAVEKGTINAESAWQLVTDGPITLGVSALAFEMAFGRTGVTAGTYRSVTVDVYGRVVAATNPTTVAGYGLTDVYTKTQTDNLLALKAALASPAFTGTPTAPTAIVGTNSNQLANTAFVQAALAALVASSPGALDTLNELAAALGNDPNFATTITNALALKAPLASPALTGVPTAPTPAAGNNSSQLANTAFVQAALNALTGAAPTTLNTLVELATAIGNDPDFVGTITSALTLKAPLASPALTGTPTAPTVAIGTNNAQLATTAFVQIALNALVGAAPTTLNTLVELAAAIGNDPDFASTINSQLNLKAPLASPALTGVPTAPTAAVGNNTTQLATTAFVRAAITALVGSSPAALDTLNELATAIGNDPNFSTTILNALAGKADKGTSLAAYGILDALRAGDYGGPVAATARHFRISSAIEEDTTSWNTLVNEGVHFRIIKGSNPGGPGGDDYYYCLTYVRIPITGGSGTLQQFALPYATPRGAGKMFWRGLSGAQWIDWEQAITASDLATESMAGLSPIANQGATNAGSNDPEEAA